MDSKAKHSYVRRKRQPCETCGKYCQGRICRECFLKTATMAERALDRCCDLPIKKHPRCRACTALVGSKHITKSLDEHGHCEWCTTDPARRRRLVTTGVASFAWASSVEV